MIEPRPCPFCASIDIKCQVDDQDKQVVIMFRSICQTCGTTGPVACVEVGQTDVDISSQEFAEHGIERATLEWNERANDLIGDGWTETE